MGSLIYPPETHAGTVTSWVPIGTTIPSPSGCESLYWSYVAGTLAVWDPGYGISVDTNIKCLPPAATSWWDQARLGIDSLTTLSLGPITCPSAYTTVTTMVQNQSSTFVACCPTNYTFLEVLSQGNTGECSSEIPAGRVIRYAIRDQQQVWSTTSTSYTTATQAWGIPINGYNIAPQTTFALTASTPVTSSTIASQTTSSSTALTLATVSTIGTPSATITPQPSSSLSKGAKAGIGVGVAFSALALGALIAFIFTQRKRKRITKGGGMASNLASPVMVQQRMHELEGKGIYEPEGRETPAEIDSAL